MKSNIRINYIFWKEDPLPFGCRFDTFGQRGGSGRASTPPRCST